MVNIICTGTKSFKYQNLETFKAFEGIPLTPHSTKLHTFYNKTKIPKTKTKKEIVVA